MAPIKMKQKPNMEKNMKVGFQFKRVKADMAKIRDDQKRIREEQTQIRGRCGEIKRQCHQLKEEAENIKKLAARNQIMLDLMFRIFKAREDGDFSEVAALTHLLREIVAKERPNASLDEEEKDEEYP